MSYPPGRIGFFRQNPQLAYILTCCLTAGVLQPGVSSVSTPPSVPISGVIVERSIVGIAGNQSGPGPNDVVVSWSRDASHGTISSPFDLETVELNEAPRGQAVLKGTTQLRPVEWVIPAGEWHLRVRPVLSPQGVQLYLRAQSLLLDKKYEQSAQAWRAAAATPIHGPSRRIHAWILLNAGKSLSTSGKTDLVESLFSDALQSAGDDAELIGHVQRQWGEFRSEIRDWNGAAGHLKAALASDESIAPESLLVARDLDELGGAAYGVVDLNQADQYFVRAIEIQKRLAPQSTLLADSLSGRGNVAQRRDDLDAAEKFHLEAIALRKAAGQQGYALARNYAGLGNIDYTRGELEKSEAWFHRAYELNIGPGGKEIFAAGNLNNLGLAAQQRGDYLESENYLRQALVIKERVVPGSLDVGSTLHNLGVLFRERGDAESAEYYLRRALKIFEKHAPDSWYVATAMHTLTLMDIVRGDLDEAETFAHKSLAIRVRVAPNSLEVSGSLNDLGNIALERGDFNGAEKYFLEALELEQKIAPERLDVAETYNSLGDVARKRSDFKKAEGLYEQALHIRERIAPGSMIHAESLADLAGVLRRERRIDEALKFYNDALSALESQTARLGGSESVRSGYRAHHADYYKDFVDLLVEQKKPEMAFQVLERFRARTLLETLNSAHVDIRKGVDPDLLQRERTLHRAIQRESDARVRLVAETHTEEQLKSADAKADGLLRQLNNVEGQIRAASPGYSALLQPSQLTSSQVQEQLLDEHTVLLEYLLGEDCSHVFLLTSHSLDVYELPDRTRIEKIARQVYRSLTRQNKPSSAETGLQKQRRLVEEDAEFARDTRELSQVLLGPVADKLGDKRLLVVSDGALAYIPFAMLPELKAGNEPLVVKHEIINLPSASVLAVLRQQESARRRPQKAVVVLADPVFASSDPRVIAGDQIRRHRHPILEENPADMSLERSAQDIGASRNGEAKLPRLKFTRQEAEAILSVSPRSQSMQALDFQASRATALSREMAQYRIVHFATHGFLDSKHPELSGLVLSLVDRKGRPQIGFLDLEDIYNLDLPVDLVVLSACETGLGKEINGEGLIGLTRGFMHAGASRVVASLWNVSDEATANLMAEFYRSMESDKIPPAAALRRAQIKMLSMKRWTSPYYWAAFQIQGEWK